MTALGELRRLGSRKEATGKRSKAARQEERAAYVFLLPWLAGLVLITLAPIATSFYISLTDYNLLQPPRFVGMRNYLDMLGDDRLQNSLRVTFVYVFVSVPLQLVMALAVAVLLNRGMRGLAFYRSVYYLPSLLGGSVAIAVLWRRVFGGDGLVNHGLAAIGVHDAPSWVADPSTALGTLVILNIWTFGAPMVIFLAGLRQVPVSLYEAAVVDGAGKWRRFTRITLPVISPIIFFNVVLQIIHAFQAFTQAFIVSGGSGGPSDSTMFFTLYLYQTGFGRFQMGYASAMAWVLLVIIAAFTAINFWASRFWVFYDD